MWLGDGKGRSTLERTVSSLVNSEAAVIYFDIVTPFCKDGGDHVDVIVKALVGAVMTGCSLVVPYMGSLVAGAGITALIVVAYQMVHLSVRVNSGAQEQRMAVSLEFCAENVTTATGSPNVTLETLQLRDVEQAPGRHPQAGAVNQPELVIRERPLTRNEKGREWVLPPLAWGSSTYNGKDLAWALGGTQLIDVGNSNLTSEVLVPLWRFLKLMPPAEKLKDLAVRKFRNRNRRGVASVVTSPQFHAGTGIVHLNQ
ncbi:hypothetical protein HPB50_014637 [Hyalomma asiaticum]|uniref:Uncharacterized protein n=1 Tax=Hyalomma asiaticum TaxID=266040 RepID=A0ACB7RMU9_HYAAI|nr:hypothetical protein HPB50_014637 [Hyalomma asiaticum]